MRNFFKRNRWGHHWVILLLNGQSIRMGLLIDYTSTRQENLWQGTAIVPVEYLPARVTKMNIFAYHGTGENRITEALYPFPSGSSAPFDEYYKSISQIIRKYLIKQFFLFSSHNLSTFQPFDSKIIRSGDPGNPSSVWSESMSG